MAYTNSPLVTYTNLSPNHSGTRNHAIDTITIHCVVGQWTAKVGCDYFAKTTRAASCNYIVGKDGSIGLCVEEKTRSRCSSSSCSVTGSKTAFLSAVTLALLILLKKAAIALTEPITPATTAKKLIICDTVISIFRSLLLF